MDEKALCKLLLKQPAAEELAFDAELMSSFLHSCSIASEKPSSGSPSSVLISRASPTRFSYTHYMRAIDDLSKYKETVASGIVIIGNGRSVLSTSAGGLVDNFGMVVRFNEYQTESAAHPPLPSPSTHSRVGSRARHPLAQAFRSTSAPRPTCGC